MPKKSPKYSKRIVAEIVELLTDDDYTIESVCAKVGIASRTFRKWRDEIPEFADALEEARIARGNNFALIARNSLRKKIEGYDVTETRTVTVPSKHEKGDDGKPKPQIKEQIITKRHVAADTAAIIFTLTNCDPENWRNRQTTEVTGKDGKDLFGQMTDEELDAIIKEHQEKLK